MKRIALSLALVLQVSAAISQNFTKTQLSKDSLVAIPKQYAIWLVQDAERSRFYSNQIELMNEVITQKDDVMMKQDTLIRAFRERNDRLSNTLRECQDLTDSQGFMITDLEKEVKKNTSRKKWWRTLAIGAAVGAVGVHYHWKYGRGW